MQAVASRAGPIEGGTHAVDIVGVKRLIGPSIASANTALENASAISIGFLALIWIALVGIAEYWTGPEYTMLIFYLIPVTLGTWFGSRSFGMLLAVLSITTSSIGDLASGLPQVRYWREAVGLTLYVIFVAMLSRWRALLNHLDDRVRARTAALQEEIVERVRLEKEMNDLTERERRRLGHDLHDSLCQHLTGTALSAQTLREKLAANGTPGMAEADKVVNLIEQGIDLTRTLARGLFSPDLDRDGLSVALAGLSHSTTERFGIACEFHHDSEQATTLPAGVSTQLYRIAQEAVANACRHAHATRVIIELDEEEEEVKLNVYDDGIGFAQEGNGSGLGLRMMQHGAELIGATLAVKRNGIVGTVVACSLRLPRPDSDCCDR
jgi:signal transduction histidine kinase